MSSVWKALLGLALVVPLGAYVAGSLAASATEDPAPRQTIVIDESSPSPSPSKTPSKTPRPSHSSTPESPRPGVDDGDDVEVIVPEYDDFDDDDDEGDDDDRAEDLADEREDRRDDRADAREDRRDDRDDDSGPGGGDDD